MTRKLILAVSLAGTGFLSSARADIITVPGDFATIQAAINASANGDEIVVSDGTYNERINLLGKAITVRSVNGFEVTTINAGGVGSAVTCNLGEGATTVIQGFTVTGAAAGGMLNDGSSPMIDLCRFVDNASNVTGGGMRNIRGASPTVRNSAFDGNTANDGAGMANNGNGTRPNVNGCRFLGNNATSSGGGMASTGGASPTVLNSRFTLNSAGLNGGGMQNTSGSATITNVIFQYNSAPTAAGMLNSASTVNISASQFLQNSALFAGGAILNDGATVGVGTSLFCQNTPNNITGPFTDNGGNDFAAECPDPCPGDIDGDGLTGFGDLVQVLSVWGPCKGCPEDLDGNGVVDFRDVLVVLSEWGPCPGACTLVDDPCASNCVVVSANDCARLERFYHGDGAACACGACCLPGGACTDGDNQRNCEEAGGEYQGDRTLCGDVECPP